MERLSAADEPGACAIHGTPGAIRLHSAADSANPLDLCMECFQLRAVMTARDDASLAHLYRAASRLRAHVWRHGETFYLVRDGGR